MNRKKKKGGQPTIKDIAREADVSATTVSLALEDKPTTRVSQATREKILSIAEKLNYRPNYAARTLATQKSRAIGLVVPTLRNPIYAEFAQELIDRSSEMGYGIITCSANGEEEQQRNVTHDLLDRGVDGLIICSSFRDCPVLNELHEQGIPLVLAVRANEARPGHSRVDFIGMDNRLGAYQLTSHFIRMGHTRIGLLCGPQQTSTGYDRRQGALDALEAFGLACDPDLIVSGDFQRKSGFELGMQLMKLSKPPSAILAANDNMAVGVLMALRELGKKAPDDVSVAGFDDIEVAGLPGIELTTVSQKFSPIGRLAIDRLIYKISHTARGNAQQVLFDPVLVIRQSCGFKALGENYLIPEPKESTGERSAEQS